MKAKQPTVEQIKSFQRLMEQFSQTHDRVSFMRQRCSGLGRMECQTLQILERYRVQKTEIRARIKKGQLTPDEVAAYLPRCLRSDYQTGSVRKDLLEQLPRDLTMKTLADEIGVACSRMTRIGDTLSDEVDPVTRKRRGKGLIHREPSPDDRRVILIRITEAGSRRVRKQEGQADRLVRLLMEQIPAARMETVQQVLAEYILALERILPALSEANVADDISDDCNVSE